MAGIAEIFASSARHRGIAPLPAYAAALAAGTALLERHGLVTPLRIAHFLAQILHETDGGRVRRESLAYRSGARLMQVFGLGRHSAGIRPEEVPLLLGQEEALAERVYGLGNPAKARALGNARPGDGYLYRGGGLMQTTGRAAYRRQGARAGVDFEADPDLIASPAHALAPAVLEWADAGLNEAADRDDVAAVTHAINGGLNGLEDRRAWLAVIRLVTAGDAPPAWRAAADEGTAWVQDALNRLGADPILAVDGLPGPATAEAVRAFQARAGLEADGVAGPITRGALRARLPA